MTGLRVIRRGTRSWAAHGRAACFARSWYRPLRAAEPGREAVPKTEAAGREPLFVGGTDRVRVRGAGRVRVGGEWRQKRMEDISGKGHEGWQGGIAGGEGDLKAQNCRCIGTCSNMNTQSLGHGIGRAAVGVA